VNQANWIEEYESESLSVFGKNFLGGLADACNLSRLGNEG
jgi:hypothetical protein